jgi:hypothetical protein
MLSKLSHSLAVIKSKQADPSGRSNHIFFFFNLGRMRHWIYLLWALVGREGEAADGRGMKELGGQKVLWGCKWWGGAGPGSSPSWLACVSLASLLASARDASTAVGGGGGRATTRRRGLRAGDGAAACRGMLLFIDFSHWCSVLFVCGRWISLSTEQRKENYIGPSSVFSSCSMLIYLPKYCWYMLGYDSGLGQDLARCFSMFCCCCNCKLHNLSLLILPVSLQQMCASTRGEMLMPCSTVCCSWEDDCAICLLVFLSLSLSTTGGIFVEFCCVLFQLLRTTDLILWDRKRKHVYILLHTNFSSTILYYDLFRLAYVFMQ